MKTDPVRSVLVIGGASGLGKASALCLARMNLEVWLADYNLTQAADVADQIKAQGGRAHACLVDIGDSASVKKLFSDLQKQLERLDLMVLTAAIMGETASIEAIDDESWQNMMRINLNGVFYVCRESVTWMKQHRTGRLILFSSVASLDPTPGALAYSCSKAAVNMMAKTLAKEVAGHNIRVNVIAPGYVQTPMLAALPEGFDAYVQRRTPLKRMAEPEEIAALVAFLTGDQADFFTGQVISPNGGFVI